MRQLVECRKKIALTNCNSAPDEVSTALENLTIGTALHSREINLGLDQLQKLCERLAERLQPGDSILLHGPLAAGKTQLVKFLAEALGTGDPITSPTFGLANFYKTNSMPILHIDTYRLENQAEFRQLGLDEYFDNHLTLVEWGEKVRTDFEDPLEVTFDFASEGEREIILSWQGAHWSPKVDHALAAFA